MERLQGKKRFAALATLLCVLVVIPTISSAASTSATAPQPLMTIAVSNNSSREIHHLYLSPVDRDLWGPDLLSEGTILRTGETFTISDVTCTGNELKVIAEDRQGCFVYTVVGCAAAATGWTITDANPPDCGN